MKKILHLFVTLFLLITLVSCSDDTKPQSISSEGNNPVVENDLNRNPESENSESMSEEEMGSLTPEAYQKVNDLYEKGFELYMDQNFNEALDLFNQVLALDPQNYKAINSKGATYAFQGRYSEGVELIQQSIKLKPDYVYAHFNLGLAYELARKYDESIEAYKKALELDDKDVWSYYGIASIYGRKGDVENVIKWLRPAMHLEPDVKAVARDEEDFDPVRNNPQFQALFDEE